MVRVGVFVCHCGVNIAGVVDVRKVAEAMRREEGVVVAEDYPYMCSQPGQELIKERIRSHSLERVVVASCSPRMHLETFMRAAAAAGLNKYCVEMANIREQCSWVHDERSEATKKAILLVRAAVAKARRLQPLAESDVGVCHEALVIGGGIAGIQAALDIAEAGFKVHLVEKEPSIGGHMAQLDKTFPTLDCSACILTPKMVDVGQNPNINLLTYAEVEDVSGFVGNFKVKVRLKSRHVDLEKCTGCDLCTQNCLVRYIPQRREPKSVENELAPEMKSFLDQVLQTYNYDGSQAIAVLQAINGRYRHLPQLALRYVSEKLGLPLSRIYHLATFYSCFSLVPRGVHKIRVCMGTACYSRGAPEIVEEFKRVLGINPGQTTKDGLFTLETVNCLGCCAIAPVVVVDDEYYANFTPAKVEQIISKYSADAETEGHT